MLLPQYTSCQDCRSTFGHLWDTFGHNEVFKGNYNTVARKTLILQYTTEKFINLPVLKVGVSFSGWETSMP